MIVGVLWKDIIGIPSCDRSTMKNPLENKRKRNTRKHVYYHCTRVAYSSLVFMFLQRSKRQAVESRKQAFLRYKEDFTPSVHYKRLEGLLMQRFNGSH